MNADQAVWCFFGTIPILVGLLCIIFPDSYSTILDDNEERLPLELTNPFPAKRSLWKVLLVGGVLVAFGLFWVCMVLFGKPADGLFI